MSSIDTIAEAERLRSLLKTVESAHATELLSLRERVSMFEAELCEQSSAFEKERASVDTKLSGLQSILVDKDLEISCLNASLVDSHHLNESLRCQVLVLLLLTISFLISPYFTDMCFLLLFS